MYGLGLIFVIALIAVSGILGGVIASAKHRNILGWGLLSALFPLIYLPILFFLSNLGEKNAVR